MDIKTVKELVEIFKKEDLTKLKVGDEYLRVHIEKEGTGSEPSVSSAVTENSGASSSNIREIRASQVGTFYLQKDENSNEQFVTAGDSVSDGDQVGMIEAMKVFNDVICDCEGAVDEILIENGDDVEYDQLLMTIKLKEG